MTTSEKAQLRHEGLSWRAINGQVIVLDLESSKYLSLNATGSVLWPLLARGATPSEMAGTLAEEFKIEPASALIDVEAFLANCWRQGLLRGEA